MLSISAVIDCGNLDDPDNGQVELSNTTLGSTANFTCSQGYSLSNGNNTRTCEANGQWSGDPPFCECKHTDLGVTETFVHSQVHVCNVSAVIKCGSLDDPANGQVELSNITVGSSANYTCTQGYILSNGNNTRTCEVDGEWSGNTPICERKS